jgi:hypothetical protein
MTQLGASNQGEQPLVLLIGIIPRVMSNDAEPYLALFTLKLCMPNVPDPVRTAAPHQFESADAATHQYSNSRTIVLVPHFHRSDTTHSWIVQSLRVTDGHLGTYNSVFHNLSCVCKGHYFG